MGERGPVPKRDAQRRRRNKEAKAEVVPYAGAAVDAPPVQKSWSPAAKRWYESLTESGQAQFFEPSDWQAAQLVAGELSVYLRSEKRSAMMWSHIWTAMTDLLTTEGARRRLKIEIERDPAGRSEDDQEAATIARLDEYRDRAAG
jgi:hypothetical protein